MENKNEIKYQDWPEIVKLVTAFSNKIFYFKNAGIVTGLGLFLVVMGIASVVYAFFGSEQLALMEMMSPLGYILIGLANLISGHGLKWISENSSWEERFRNKSPIAHKLGNFFITLILIGCLGMVIYTL